MTSVNVRTALVAVVLATLGAPASAAAGPTPVAIGGLQGTRYVAARADARYEPTEDVTVDFDSPIDPASFEASLTIDPPVRARVSARALGKRMVVQFRKTPGQVYRVHVAAGVRALDGMTTTQPLDFTVATAADPVPSPLRSTAGEPYRYGVLAHPYPFSLDGPNAEKIIDLLANAGVRFVRIDYDGAQIESTEGHFDFHIEDRIADRLAARGITELPIVLQYNAPLWATDGARYPAIWKNPEVYAQFARAVAAHLAQRESRVSRIELFNEPNLVGWWKNPADPAYAANDGSAAAHYLASAYAAIKGVAPGMTVVAPALASGGRFVDPRAFFERLYANGCRRGACWDVLSIHNYRWANPTFPTPDAAANRFDIYRAIEAIATSHGDAGTHVMLTEWGYSTDASADGVDPQTQARYLALGFNLMLADPLVDGIVYVNMWNPAPDFWGQTALVGPDFTPKPAYAVYRAFARGDR